MRYAIPAFLLRLMWALSWPAIASRRSVEHLSKRCLPGHSQVSRATYLQYDESQSTQCQIGGSGPLHLSSSHSPLGSSPSSEPDSSSSSPSSRACTNLLKSPRAIASSCSSLSDSSERVNLRKANAALRRHRAWSSRLSTGTKSQEKASHRAARLCNA